MDASDLRIALFSGNYNYVRDGANQALNRLVDYLLRQGAQVRVYAPVVENPAFPGTGEMVHIRSVSIPKRREYRIPIGLGSAVRRDLEEFNPNIVHISSPDIAAQRAVTWARKRSIATVASVHTRFETYLSYYHIEFLEAALRSWIRRLYRRCDALLVPAESTAAVLRAQHMSKNIHIWSRGVDREQFNPGRHDMEWRRSLGIADNELAVTFLGRLVLEKGLEDFASALDVLHERGVPHHALVIGKGPAREWFQERMPQGVFVGHLTGDELGHALASGDVFLNPSVTEAFGNVTQEAMACGLPVIAAEATGTTSLIKHNVNGMLVDPGDIDGYADALQAYCTDPELRRRHGEAGLEYTKTRDWDTINSVVLDVYRKTIARRERLARLGH